MLENLSDIIKELDNLKESNEKLKFLLALATDLPDFPEEEKIEENKISGCASNAYIVAECKDKKMYFRGDADAQIPKGILALFIFGCEAATPEEILALQPDFLESTGLKNILSPSRVNGAYHIYKRVQEEAEKILKPKNL